MKKTTLILAALLSGSIGFAQIIYTVAGNGTSGYSGNGGLALSAQLNGPMGVTVDGNGNLYIADNGNNVIRKVTPTGVITTVAGNGTAGYSGNGGAATSAELSGPVDVAVDASNNLYIADRGNNVIRKVTASTGIISTYAGYQYVYSGTWYFGGDGGAATSAFLASPYGVALDGSGNLYIADSQNFRVRKVNTSGTISTYAGGGTSGIGDGGAATSAELSQPVGVDVDGSGNLFISDVGYTLYGGQRVRKVNTSGTISTYAGNGTGGFTGNGGAATSAEVNDPYGVATDGSGNLFIADEQNFEVRKVSSGNINAYAGNHTQGNTGDGGLATSAEIDVAYGIATDGSGNVYIPDYTHNIIRKVSTLCPANAGPNVVDHQSCCGTSYPGVNIGTAAVSGMTYAWSPSTALNSTSVAQPLSTWSNTTTCQVYTVTVSGTSCTTSTSTVQVCAQAYHGASCCKLGHFYDSMPALPEKFSVYPNPARDKITVSLYALAELIQVVDLQGRIVYEAKNVEAGELSLDLSKYNKGVYFVIARIGEAIEKQKIVVE